MISYEIWAKQQHKLIELLWSFHYVLLLPLIACEDQHKAVWGNESQIENRNVFFLFPSPPPALFIQLLCRRGHKFCSRAICFSKAQYKCHTQGSEVQALVCLMHNLYWSTPSFVLSSWPRPQASLPVPNNLSCGSDKQKIQRSALQIFSKNLHTTWLHSCTFVFDAFQATVQLRINAEAQFRGKNNDSLIRSGLCRSWSKLHQNKKTEGKKHRELLKIWVRPVICTERPWPDVSHGPLPTLFTRLELCC